MKSIVARLLMPGCVTIAQLGCSGPPTLKFAELAGLENPPTVSVPLWIEVIDFTDTTAYESSFHGQMRFHEISPDLPERIRDSLTPMEFLYVGKTGYKHRIMNPFVVVADSAEAELTLRVAVFKSGYGRGREIAGNRTESLSVHPQAHLQIFCQLRKPPESKVVYEFDALAVSNATGQRGRALNEALDMAVGMIVKKLVEPTTGY